MSCCGQCGGTNHEEKKPEETEQQEKSAQE